MKSLILALVVCFSTSVVQAQQEKVFNDTTGETRDVATRYFSHYMAMDWDRLEPMLHADATFEDPTAELLFGGKPHRGKDNVIKNFRDGYASLTSMKANSLRTIFSGKSAVFQFELSFGFRNRHNGITTINMPLVVVVTVKDGKVIEHRDYGDYREYLAQIKKAREEPTPEK